MSAAQLQFAAAALVRRSTTEQGLTEQVTDAVALRRVAALLVPGRGNAPVSSPGRCVDLLPLAGVEEVGREQL